MAYRRRRRSRIGQVLRAPIDGTPPKADAFIPVEGNGGYKIAPEAAKVIREAHEKVRDEEKA